MPIPAHAWGWRPERPDPPEQLEQPELPPGLAAARPVFAHFNQVPPLPRRPHAVTAAAVLLFVSAALAILGGTCLGLVVSAADAAPGEVTMIVTIFVASLVAFAVLDAVLAAFILQGRPWARAATMAYLPVSVGFLLAGTFLTVRSDADVGASAGSGGLWVVLHLVVIGLLSGPSARFYFRAMR
jgi:hypothetical protein